MDQRTRPAPRLAPLPPEHTPELKEQFEAARKRIQELLDRRLRGRSRRGGSSPVRCGGLAS